VRCRPQAHLACSTASWRGVLLMAALPVPQLYGVVVGTFSSTVAGTMGFGAANAIDDDRTVAANTAEMVFMVCFLHALVQSANLRVEVDSGGAGASAPVHTTEVGQRHSHLADQHAVMRVGKDNFCLVPIERPADAIGHER